MPPRARPTLRSTATGRLDVVRQRNCVRRRMKQIMWQTSFSNQSARIEPSHLASCGATAPLTICLDGYCFLCRRQHQPHRDFHAIYCTYLEEFLSRILHLNASEHCLDTCDHQCAAGSKPWPPQPPADSHPSVHTPTLTPPHPHTREPLFTPCEPPLGIPSGEFAGPSMADQWSFVHTSLHQNSPMLM